MKQNHPIDVTGDKTNDQHVRLMEMIPEDGWPALMEDGQSGLGITEYTHGWTDSSL